MISLPVLNFLKKEMKIAIQAADLDNKRIDGTRVYLLNVLKFLGEISSEDEFLIYHRKEFNRKLAPADFPNYAIKQKDFPFLWTQIRFALELWRDNPDVLWMPMHNMPLIRRKKMKTVVTIHDLAFKLFPESFPAKDLRSINFLTDNAVKNVDKIIAISQSTKKDILKFYPEVGEEKIKVIHHGFDAVLFQKNISEQESGKVLGNYNLKAKSYLLYVGAIQPRKNLEVLIKAFEIYKKNNKNIKLVLAGSKAWLWEGIFERIEKSEFRKDIIETGRVGFNELAALYQNASVFIFPPKYEGFGIPILEAFASGVPVISAKNSSLEEVGGTAAEYFQTEDAEELAEKMKKVAGDEVLRKEMIKKGAERAAHFSWEKCARETLEYLKS